MWGEGTYITADAAICDIDDGVETDFLLHDHPTHGSRRIIAGSPPIVNDMKLIVLGAVNGRERSPSPAGRFPEQSSRAWSWQTPSRWTARTAPSAEGDSGAPCLYKVRDGAYQIAAIVFAGRGQGDSVTGYAFPASAAERALGITFGEQLPALGVNEQSGFNLSLYKPSRALRGFSGQALSLESIDEHGASRRLVGPRIPDTGEIVHHWWDISLAASSVSLTIHGGPDTHPQFVGGRTWGFKVLVKRTEDE